MAYGLQNRFLRVALGAILLSCGTVESKRDPSADGGSASPPADANDERDGAIEAKATAPDSANSQDAANEVGVCTGANEPCEGGRGGEDAADEATTAPLEGGPDGKDGGAEASRCADDDDDGICNERDRCPTIPRQDDTADIDADGIPDACDPCGPGLLLAQRPLAYYRLNEAASTATAANTVRTSGAFPNGLYGSGVVRRVQSRALDDDPAARFTSLLDAGAANASVVTIAAPPFPKTAITLALWIRINEAASSGIVSYAQGDKDGNDFLLYYDANPTALADGAAPPPALQLEISGVKGQETGVNLPIDEWHHVALTWESSSGTLKLYRDGALASQNVYAAGQQIGSSDGGAGVLMLGQEQDGVPPDASIDPTQAFRGDLDEVFFYDRVLSSAEVLAHVQTALCK